MCGKERERFLENPSPIFKCKVTKIFLSMQILLCVISPNITQLIKNQKFKSYLLFYIQANCLSRKRVNHFRKLSQHSSDRKSRKDVWIIKYCYIRVNLFRKYTSVTTVTSVTTRWFMWEKSFNNNIIYYIILYYY